MEKNDILTRIQRAAQSLGDKLDGVVDQQFDGSGYLARVFSHARDDGVSTITLMLFAIIGYEISFALLGWWL